MEPTATAGWGSGWGWVGGGGGVIIIILMYSVGGDMAGSKRTENRPSQSSYI